MQNFEDDETENQIGGTLPGGRKRLFSKELRCMMYGFGDDQNPYTESVDLLEDLVIEFITEMTHRAMEIGRTGRVQVEDIVFLGTLGIIFYWSLILWKESLCQFCVKRLHEAIFSLL